MKKIGSAKFLILFASLCVAVVARPAAAQNPAEKTYKAKCAVCHAADGTGDTAMGKKTGARDFRSPEVQKMTDAELTKITAKGKEKMPAYEKSLKPGEIQQLVAYVRELGKKEAKEKKD